MQLIENSGLLFEVETLEELELKVFSYGSAQTIGSELQFGFESEYTIEESGKILEKYEPLDRVASIRWAEKTLSEKKDWLKSTIESMGHGNKGALLVQRGADESLPKYIYRDDTKNIEVILEPTSDYRAFFQKIESIGSILGFGSMQAMVSIPRDLFFQAWGSDSYRMHLGWLNFVQEFDVLQRLLDGYERKSLFPLRSFDHPFLGPMVHYRHHLQKKFLRENASGDLLDDESLIRPSRRDHSFKFVGSTAYRPDIAAPTRICYEVRDAHKNLDLLKHKVDRIVSAWNSDLNRYQKFSKVLPFNSEEEFEQFSLDVQEKLIEISPHKVPEAVKEFDKARVSHEVFRNYSYPLRDWSVWLSLLDCTDLLTQVQKAQEDFKLRMSNITAYKNAVSARSFAQKNICLFAYESGILEAFAEFLVEDFSKWTH